MFCLALCHTVLIEKINGEVIYNASSPDELALVNCAKFCGFEYLGIDENNNMMVEYKKKIYKYEILYILEFNSIRYF